MTAELSERDREVLDLYAQGYGSEAIAIYQRRGPRAIRKLLNEQGIPKHKTRNYSLPRLKPGVPLSATTHEPICERCGHVLTGATNRNRAWVCDICHDELCHGVLYELEELSNERLRELGYVRGHEMLLDSAA